MRIPILGLAVLLLLAARASAQPFAANFATAGLVPLSMPLDPLGEGRLAVSVSPAYLSFKTYNSNGGSDDFKDGHALGGGGSIVYGLSEHFGLGLTGLGFSGTGNYNPGSLGSGAPSGSSPGPWSSKTYGGLLAASLIVDPFEGEGFRLPFLAGVHYESLHDKIDYGGGNTEKQDLDSAGIQAGVSAQFNTGPLRWEPFGMVYFPFGHEKQALNGAVSGNNIHSDAGPQPGVNLVFTPWNLSLFYVYGVQKAKGTHVYSLRWKAAFGGS